MKAKNLSHKCLSCRVLLTHGNCLQEVLLHCSPRAQGIWIVYHQARQVSWFGSVEQWFTYRAWSTVSRFGRYQMAINFQADDQRAWREINEVKKPRLPSGLLALWSLQEIDRTFWRILWMFSSIITNAKILWCELIRIHDSGRSRYILTYWWLTLVVNESSAAYLNIKCFGGMNF